MAVDKLLGFRAPLETGASRVTRWGVSFQPHEVRWVHIHLSIQVGKPPALLVGTKRHTFEQEE